MIRGGMEFKTGRPILIPQPPDSVVVHKLQLWCPTDPTVMPGGRVTTGQAIAPACPGRSGVRRSPACGVVQRITLGAKQGGWAGGVWVAIDAEGRAESATLDRPAPAGRKLGTWIDAMHDADLWPDADGAVGILAQLQAAAETRIDTVICVGVDRFPPYPDASSLLTSFAEPAVLGTSLIGDVVGAANVTMLAAKRPTLVRKLKKYCQSYRLRMKTIEPVYPAADPTVVAWSHASGRRRLPAGANPASVGVMLISPWTAIRIGRWFERSKLDIARPVLTAWPVRGSAMSVGYALPGQSLSGVEGWQDAALPRGARVLYGDPMTGLLDEHDSRRTDPGDGLLIPERGLLVSVVDAPPRLQPTECISCGWCVDVCPTRLRPIDLMRKCKSHPDSASLAESLRWCTGCGLCSHVCPSSLPIAQVLTHTRAAGDAADGIDKL